MNGVDCPIRIKSLNRGVIPQRIVTGYAGCPSQTDNLILKKSYIEMITTTHCFRYGNLLCKKNTSIAGYSVMHQVYFTGEMKNKKTRERLCKNCIKKLKKEGMSKLKETKEGYVL